jgi:hypothetical protein
MFTGRGRGASVAELVKRHLLATLDLGFVVTDASGAPPLLR